ncbi:MAG: c-type cytochrome, partial [Planctomycetota bacterium]
ALFALHAGLNRDTSQRNVEIFTEMAYSKAYESYSPNPNFSNGLTQQALVAGVVPRGHVPFPYAATEEDAVRAGEELTNPIAADDAAALKEGAALYAVYCLPCHDVRGEGFGPVVLRGMVGPPMFQAARAKDMKDGQMFHILTLGQGNMASYRAQLSPRERWAVIAHVRTLQEPSP